jgi:predicted permease
MRARVKQLLSAALSVFKRNRLERDFDEEMQGHLDMLRDRFIRQGMTPDDAGFAARRAFGNRALLAEDVRAMWQWGKLEDVAQNVKHALRQMGRNKSWTVMAVLSLALGIGANTALFSLVDAVFFKPIGVGEPSRVVALSRRYPDFPVQRHFGYPEYETLRDAGAGVVDLAAFTYLPADIDSGSGSERSLAALVSGNYFATLGVSPWLGRLFAAQEFGPPGLPVAVVSHRFWQRQLQGSATVPGKSLLLNGRRFTIIGVLPAGFNGTLMGSEPAVWLPATMWQGIMELPSAFRGLNFDPLASNGMSWLFLVGRLKPEAGVESAKTALDEAFVVQQTGRRVEERFRSSIALAPLADARLPEEYSASTPLMAGVTFGIVAGLLLIACANVAGMLAARAAARQREIAIRAAIGASRFRIVGEMLTESLVLAAFGGATGMLLALGLLSLLESWRPAITIPIPSNISLDWRLLLFTAAVSVLSGVAVGVFAALRGAGADPRASLQQAFMTSAGDGRTFAARNASIVGQVAVSVVMLVTAGLLLRTFLNVQAIPIGFDPQGLIVLNADFLRHGYTEDAAIGAYPQLLERLQAVPGVASASLVESVPLSSASSAWTYEEPIFRGIQIVRNTVTPDFFETMRIPLLRGRSLSSEDVPGSAPVSVVNEAYVRVVLKGEEPIGRIEDKRLIVGLVRDNRNWSLRHTHATEEPRYYVPFAQASQPRMSIVVRTRLDARTMVAPLLQAAREIDPAIPSRAAWVMTEQLQGLLWQPHLAALLANLFGLLAALLAAVGIYGLVSFEVNRRINEIGIRMALGAGRAKIARLVLQRGAALAFGGIGLGTAISLALTRWLAAMLYEVSPTDAVVFFAIAVLLITVTAIASLAPLWRATRLDLTEVLRQN